MLGFSPTASAPLASFQFVPAEIPVVATGGGKPRPKRGGYNAWAAPFNPAHAFEIVGNASTAQCSSTDALGHLVHYGQGGAGQTGATAAFGEVDNRIPDNRKRANMLAALLLMH